MSSPATAYWSMPARAVGATFPNGGTLIGISRAKATFSCVRRPPPGSGQTPTRPRRSRPPSGTRNAPSRLRDSRWRAHRSARCSGNPRRARRPRAPTGIVRARRNLRDHDVVLLGQLRRSRRDPRTPSSGVVGSSAGLAAPHPPIPTESASSDRPKANARAPRERRPRGRASPPWRTRVSASVRSSGDCGVHNHLD